MIAAETLLATEWCPQCYRQRPLELFVSKNGQRFTTTCADCRKRYSGWSTLSVAERQARLRAKPRTGVGYFVALTLKSKNRKTGLIPVSMTDMVSCPQACIFRDRGCYAEYGNVRAHWQTVPERGTSWREFCEAIAALPPGQLWRHNEAGDLPGRDDNVDIDALDMLVEANRGRRGFTYTHKPVTKVTVRRAIRKANDAGFTINLSAGSLAEADRLADLAIAPIAVVLPTGTPARSLKTPAGRTVVICPAETHAITCSTCELCAKPWRKSIVGFRAHGQAKAIVSDLVTLRRKTAPPPALEGAA